MRYTDQKNLLHTDTDEQIISRRVERTFTGRPPGGDTKQHKHLVTDRLVQVLWTVLRDARTLDAVSSETFRRSVSSSAFPLSRLVSVSQSSTPTR